MNSWIAKIEKSNDIMRITKSTFPTVKGGNNAIVFHNAVKLIMSNKMKDEQILNLLPKLYKIYVRLYPNINTLKQRLSDIRKIIKVNQSERAYTESTKDKYFNLNFDERSKLKNDYNSQVLKKNKNLIQIDKSEIINKIESLILSENKYDRAIALLLAYGARVIGLFDKNVVTTTRKEWVRVDGIAKKRGKQEHTIRPVLSITPRRLIKEIARLRLDFADKKIIVDGKMASDKLNTLNKTVVKHFPWLKDSRNKASMLRKIYADLAWDQYKNKYTNKQVFISEVLGHSSLNTSFSYTTVNVN